MTSTWRDSLPNDILNTSFVFPSKNSISEFWKREIRTASDNSPMLLDMGSMLYVSLVEIVGLVTTLTPKD